MLWSLISFNSYLCQLFLIKYCLCITHAHNYTVYTPTLTMSVFSNYFFFFFFLYFQFSNIFWRCHSYVQCDTQQKACYSRGHGNNWNLNRMKQLISSLVRKCYKRRYDSYDGSDLNIQPDLQSCQHSPVLLWYLFFSHSVLPWFDTSWIFSLHFKWYKSHFANFKNFS